MKTSEDRHLPYPTKNESPKKEKSLEKHDPLVRANQREDPAETVTKRRINEQFNRMKKEKMIRTMWTKKSNKAVDTIRDSPRQLRKSAF